MAVDSGSIAGGQAAPGDKAHGFLFVEAEDRGPLATHRLAHGVEPGLVDVLLGFGAEQSIGQPVTRAALDAS